MTAMNDIKRKISKIYSGKYRRELIWTITIAEILTESLVVIIDGLILKRDMVRGLAIGGTLSFIVPFIAFSITAYFRVGLEEALEDSEKRFRAAFENAAVGASMVDLRGRFIRVNKSLCDMLGYTEKELLSKTFSDVTHPDDVHIGLDYLKRQIAGEVDYASFEKRYVRSDGSVLHVVVSPSLIRDSSGEPQYFVGLFQNITERIKAMDELKGHREHLEELVRERTSKLESLNEQLMKEIEERKKVEIEKQALQEQFFQSQKMDAIGQFAGGVAHDFNNRLASILNNCALLKIKMKADDEPMRKHVDRIIASSERAAALISTLLTFSRKQVFELKDIDLNKIIEGIGHLLASVAGDAIELKISLSVENLHVMADGNQIENALINIATNARDAMPEGGSLNITTRAVKSDRSFSERFNCLPDVSYALVSVSDTGIGMDNTTREKIFDPFFTTKGLGKGTGLGLSTVYGIIKQHGGYIDVESEYRKGTRFNIYLPLNVKTDGIEAKGKEAAIGLADNMGHGEIILLAEDDAEVRKSTKEILEGSGYEVIEASDGEEALNKFVSAKDKIWLLILDVIMPKLNGKIVSDRAKEIRPDTKILFMSGYTSTFLGEKDFSGQDITLMNKPFAAGELLNNVRRILDS